MGGGVYRMVFNNIQVRGNRIEVPGKDLVSGYYEFRRAIMDGEIPVSMPVGFYLNSPKNVSPTTAVDRNHSCQESMVAISANVSNLIFIGNVGKEVSTEEQEGVITTGNATWKSNGRKECYPVNPDQHIMTATAPMAIRFTMLRGTGFHSIADNAKMLGKETWFPLSTSHTLIEYVRVLPLLHNYIEVQYVNGMTADTLQQILQEAEL